ncbi:hypothetical protein A3J78_02100 [Candidatus Beckwithbacteria bacterium RBG_13_35_6]|uniref:Glycosyl transferase family 1 domain-containing protein n=1 Tax=Candidatus Beckwithbacteria bacterium RBG_13_35_6 TaxID=1797456 RepID=A0A1F5DET4_9BACT|nr:MAG: hypothetical protein A3J78_02100 [Candidatus Beckwithbacteria bacterium RBG_13_35_6]
MKIDKLIDKYNQKESLMVISPYPKKGEKYSGNSCGAVGAVVKNTLMAFKKSKKRKIIVLTMTINDNKDDVYEEDGILVIRCLKRNQVLSFLTLIQVIKKFDKVSRILIEFEFAAYGDILVASIFPGIMIYLRLIKKNLTIVLHQVIFNINQLSVHIGLDKSALKLNFFKILLKVYYWLVGKAACRIVVLEEELKKRLSSLISPAKIYVIPLGVDKNFKILAKNLARKKIKLKKNEIILLLFGYLTWYKGVDWIIETFGKKEYKIGSKKLKFFIAGGFSFSQRNKKHYQRYLQKINTLSKKAVNIEITGYVTEEDINVYYSAADLVILPYRVFMGSPAPLSLSFAFEKPFIISKKMADIFKTQDFKEILNKNGVKKENISFYFRKESFIKTVEYAYKNLSKLSAVSKSMRKKRSFENLDNYYIKLFYDE